MNTGKSSLVLILTLMFMAAILSGCVDSGASDLIYIKKTEVTQGGKTYTGLSPINVDNDLNIIELLYTQDFNDIYKGGGAGSAGRTYTGISPIVVDNDANTIASDYNHKDYNIGYLQVQGNARFLSDLNVGSGADQVSIGKDSNRLCFPQGLACIDWNGETFTMRTVDFR